MVTFETKKVSDRITRIYGMNGEQMYLIIGEKRAALVDTATGVGDLKGLIDSLTELPTIALITHGHVDHAMGAEPFEEVYMDWNDLNVYQEHASVEMRKSYLSTSAKFTSIEEKDYASVRKIEDFKNIRDGDTFDLGGGVVIEAVSCPGHSPGSMMFLIWEERTLISGDACAFFTMLQGDSCLGLSTYERNLKKAKERTDGKYDRILCSHGSFDMPVTLINEVLEVIGEVKNGTDDRVPYKFSGTEGLVAKRFGNNGVSSYARLDGKTGNLVYNPAKIWE